MEAKPQAPQTKTIALTPNAKLIFCTKILFVSFHMTIAIVILLGFSS